MTVQSMIDTIKDNLGNRSSGRIGSRSVDTVVLEAINLGIPHLVQEAQPDYYNRTTTLSLVSGTASYTLPVVDDDGSTIRIKDIYGNKGYTSDGTPHTFIHINYKEFLNRTQGLESAATGSPCYFALWGQDNKLHLDYVPTQDYSLVMYIESFPVTITSTQLQTALPIHDEWNLVLESFATGYCYLKLQQVEMYAIWNDLYKKQKASISRGNNEKQTHNQSAGPHSGNISDPLLNPFGGNYNV